MLESYLIDILPGIQKVDLRSLIQTDNGSEFGARKRDVKTPGFVHTIVVKWEATHKLHPSGMLECKR